MKTEYPEKLLNQKKEFLNKLKKEECYFKFTTASNLTYYGEIYSADSNLLCLNPSLVYEENEQGHSFRLEERIPSFIEMNSINSVQPISKNNLDYLLSMGKSKDKKIGLDLLTDK